LSITLSSHQEAFSLKLALGDAMLVFEMSLDFLFVVKDRCVVIHFEVAIQGGLEVNEGQN
jgi:hypothetical protein